MIRRSVFLTLVALVYVGIQAQITSINSLSTFNNFIRDNDKVLVKFSATWCAPCKASQPVFEKLSTQFGSVKFVTVDVDSGSAIANKYTVRGIPAFIFIHNGQASSPITGFDGSRTIQALTTRLVTLTKE